MDERQRERPHIGATDPISPSSSPRAGEDVAGGEAAPAPAAPDRAGPESGSRADDYVDIYFSPREVFERRRDGRFGQALLVLALLSIVVYYVFLPAADIMMDAQLAEALAEEPRAAEAMQQMESFGRTMRLLMGLVVPIGVVAVVLIIGVVLKGLAGLLGVAVSMRQALVVSVFAAFVTPLQQAAGAATLILSNRDGSVAVPEDLSFGLVRFLETEALPDVVVPMLMLVDVFALWQAGLWALGLYVIGRGEKGEAIAAAAIMWLLTAVPGVGAALL